MRDAHITDKRENKIDLIERLDQGHLYPLGERRDKHVTGGAPSPPPRTAGGRSTSRAI
jgi:hypothetical protein